jgi:hypothetical protein
VAGNHGAAHAQAREGYLSRHSRQARQDASAASRGARSTRTPEQQLARLDEKLGKGVGARRERARLQQEIDERAAR